MSSRLGMALRARRKDLGLTQDEVAEIAGVSTRFVRALEGGKDSVQLGHVLRVLHALGLRMRLVREHDVGA